MGSATLVAVTVTVLGFGTEAGEVKKPLLEIEPTVELPPTVPFTLQFTPVLELLVTVAVNCCVAPTCTDADVGEMAIEGVGGGICVDFVPPQPAYSSSVNKMKASFIAIGRPMLVSPMFGSEKMILALQ